MKREVSIALLAFIALTAASSPVQAGCGCDKPPPVPATVRPHATYAGTPITIFHPGVIAGQTYVVVFRSADGGQTSVVTAEGVARRDLADGKVKSQVEVALPDLPLGPTAIEVYTQKPSDRPLVSSGDDALTVVGKPVALPDQYGTFNAPGYRAAVGRDGTAYVAFDLGGLRQPMVFQAQAKGYALRFGAEDIRFYNTQGFLMQRLVDVGSAEPVPGMFVYPAENPADSDLLHYSRHEFSTYFLQHEERQPHARSADPNWHNDGTPHIDHDHLILAIDARTQNGQALAPGATQAFTLALTTHSLFSKGLVGQRSITIENDAAVDSYDPGARGALCGGDLYSNGPITLSDKASVCGDATATKISLGKRAIFRGNAYRVTAADTVMDVDVPKGIKDLGSINILINQRNVIQGPGSFRVRNLSVAALGRLHIDNSAGPVTLYVTGKMSVALGGAISTESDDPEQFAIYMAGSDPVRIFGLGTEQFHGVVYAPYASINLGAGDFHGAFVADALIAGGTTRVHYDEALRSPIELGTDADANGIVGTSQDKPLNAVRTLTSTLLGK